MPAAQWTSTPPFFRPKMTKIVTIFDCGRTFVKKSSYILRISIEQRVRDVLNISRYLQVLHVCSGCYYGFNVV